MLLRFGVSNFKSIRDYQELSLVASSLKDDPAYLLEINGSKERAVPLVGVYGANASGKSNLLLAFGHFRSFILTSHSKGPAEGGISRNPFLLDPNSEREPSRFDCDVIIQGIRYHYGFAVDNEKILEEWLYAFPTGSRQVWFHRKSGEKPEFQFGKFLKGKNKTIEALTRENSLFLSAAAQNNHEQLSPLHRYFWARFHYSSVSTTDQSFVPDGYLGDDATRRKILSFLTFADTGISDLKMEDFEVRENFRQMFQELDSVVAKRTRTSDLFTQFMSTKPKEIRLAHRGSNGHSTYLKLDSESQGTLALLSILEPIFRALVNGQTLFIDELNTSIHTLLAIRILQLFVSPETNPKGAQLIFTTHDTNLLCANVLRRDEIWFTEKNNEGATHLYPLTNINTRKTDNLEKGYLQGRFGGIPFLGKLEDLFKVQRGA